MSCFIVDHAHIDALVDIAWQYPSRDRVKEFEKTFPELEHYTLGKALLSVNEEAYAVRYREEVEHSLTYRYQGTGHVFTPGEALQVISCYDYQCCELDDWEKTEAFKFCQALKRAVIDKAIPRAEVWEWTKRKPVSLQEKK